MDLHNKFRQAKDVIEPGEELLYHTYDMTQVPGKKVTVILAQDGGSTQTRCILLDVEELGHYAEYLNQVFVIPSTSISVLGDPVVVPVTDRLYDCMDSSIVNLSTSTGNLVDRARVVRGSKALNVEATENRIGSSTQKTLDPTFYYNIFDNLGLAIIKKYSGALPEFVEVYHSVSLPPDDTIEINVENFKRNLRKYQWTHTDSGVKFNFDFTKHNVMTEPEAEVKAYYAFKGKDEPEYTMHFNGGGRSIGIEILINGKSVKGAQQTLDFGGTQLLDLISVLYVRGVGGKPPRRDRLEEAVRTGMLKVGNSHIDISEIVKQAKREFGRRIFTESRAKVFDSQTKVVPTDLNVISVAGRLFDRGTYDFSVCETLFELYLGLTPTTETVRFTESYIPQGLLLEGLTEFFTDEELEAAFEKAEVEQAQAEAAAAAEEQDARLELEDEEQLPVASERE